MTLQEAVNRVLELADDSVISATEEQAVRQVAEFFEEYFRNFPAQA